MQINVYIYDFRIFNTVRTFGRDIYEGKITLKEADEDHSELINDINEFNEKTRPKTKDKKEKRIVMKNLHNFFSAREIVLNGFKSKIFLTKSIGTGI